MRSSWLKKMQKQKQKQNKIEFEILERNSTESL